MSYRIIEYENARVDLVTFGAECSNGDHLKCGVVDGIAVWPALEAGIVIAVQVVREPRHGMRLLGGETVQVGRG